MIICTPGQYDLIYLKICPIIHSLLSHTLTLSTQQSCITPHFECFYFCFFYLLTVQVSQGNTVFPYFLSMLLASSCLFSANTFFICTPTLHIKFVASVVFYNIVQVADLINFLYFITLYSYSVFFY